MEGKNLQAAFSDTKLSEKSREALKSDTWQKARDVLRGGISETDVDVSASAEESGGFTYGVWKEALHEYVRISYKNDESMCDIQSDGVTYKVMKKDDKVTFYDASGNTLFHVAYEQLEEEYAQMMEQPEADREDCQIKRQIEESGESGLKCSGGIGEECNACEKAARTEQGNTTGKMPDKTVKLENVVARQRTAGSTKEQAKKKLEKELEKAKDRPFAEPVIGYLRKRCEEDGGLALDVMQKHKTWEKCYGYICSEARKSAQKGARSYAVPDEVVYEWAEDYYHKDDRAEEEERAKKAAEAKKKAEKRQAKAKEKTEAKEVAPAVVKTDNQKAKKNRKDMEGQLDMFSMMGM